MDSACLGIFQALADGGDRPAPVKTLADLRTKINAWDGESIPPAVWKEAGQKARRQAEACVLDMERKARKCEDKARKQQIEAARLRLLRELGRYLICLGEGAAGLNRVMYETMKRDTATAARFKECMKRLTGSVNQYPEWPEDLRNDLQRFFGSLPPGRRLARKAGSELDAALRDPRWAAAE